MSVTYRLRRNSALAIAAVCFTIALMGAAQAAGALRFYAIGLAGYAALKVLVNAFMPWRDAKHRCW